jgi:uncharacterized protein Smg (DUF494 family)
VVVIKKHNYGGMRIYSEEEKLKLGTKSRGFLLFMENMGQIDANQREMIIVGGGLNNDKVFCHY